MTELITKQMVQIRSHWRAGMTFEDIGQAVGTSTYDVRNTLRQLGELAERGDEPVYAQNSPKKRVWLSLLPEEVDMLLNVFKLRTGFPETDTKIARVYNRLMNGRSRYRKEHKLDA